MNALLQAFLLSMIPAGELRLGIPVGIVQGGDPWLVFAAAVIGNSLIIIPVFLFLEYVHRHFLHLRLYRTLFDRYMERARLKASGTIEKYGMIGLAIFVAIPLPATGAYTGTIVAWFFGMNKIKALFPIIAGVILAGIITTAVSALGITALEFLLAKQA